MFFLCRCVGQISWIIHQNTSILYDTMCWKAFYFLHCRLLWMFPWLSDIFFGHNGLTSDGSDDPTWLACFLFDWPFVPRRTSHVDKVPPHTMSYSAREVIWIMFSDAQSHSQWELLQNWQAQPIQKNSLSNSTNIYKSSETAWLSYSRSP